MNKTSDYTQSFRQNRISHLNIWICVLYENTENRTAFAKWWFWKRSKDGREDLTIRLWMSEIENAMFSLSKKNIYIKFLWFKSSFKIVLIDILNWNSWKQSTSCHTMSKYPNNAWLKRVVKRFVTNRVVYAIFQNVFDLLFIRWIS